MGVTSSKGCTGPWDPSDTAKVHYDFTGCPDEAKVYNEVVWGDSEDITFGLYNEVCAGAYLDITAGVLLEMVIGPMLEVCVGGSFEMAGMPASAWKAATLLPSVLPAAYQEFAKATAQYDIVFGTYYETLYQGAMYYWQPVDTDAFKIHGDWMESGTTLDRIKVHGDHAEVVGKKVIAAGGAGGIKYITEDPAVTVAGQSVTVQAAGTVTVGSLGDVGLSGASLLVQGTASCTLKSTNAQVMLSPAGFAASSGAALSLNAPLQEWGQPVVPPPPEPVADDGYDADDEAETEDELEAEEDLGFGVLPGLGDD
jgi:hypothetical protein